MYNLVGLANAVMKFSSVAAITMPEEWKGTEYETKFGWIFQITNVLDMILWPLLIVVAAAGSIYAVVLGVNMARADSTEKREEAKKRLVNVIVGLAIIIALILFLQLFANVIVPALLPSPTAPTT